MRVSDESMSKAREILAKVQKQRDAAEQHMNQALADGGGDDYLFWARIHRELHLVQGSLDGYMEIQQ